MRTSILRFIVKKRSKNRNVRKELLPSNYYTIHANKEEHNEAVQVVRCSEKKDDCEVRSDGNEGAEGGVSETV